MTNTNPLAAYGNWLATVSDDWPDEAVDIAYRQFIDAMAAMVPGGVAPVTLKIREVLEGKSGAAEDIVVLNSAAALWTIGVEKDLRSCADRARAAIQSGAASEILVKLAELSHK